MSATGKREETKQETRKALIQAGLEEIVKRGFDAPSLDSICARAGYTRGAFYVHFENREEFLQAVVTETLARFLRNLFSEEDDSGSIETLASRFADAIAGGASPLGQLGLRLPQLLEAGLRIPNAREGLRRLQELSIQRVAKVVRASQAAGETRGDVDADTLATVIVAFATGIVIIADSGAPLDVQLLEGALRLVRAEPGA